MPILLTFGDSNTHGTPPMTDRLTYARFDAQTLHRCAGLAAAPVSMSA